MTRKESGSRHGGRGWSGGWRLDRARSHRRSGTQTERITEKLRPSAWRPSGFSLPLGCVMNVETLVSPEERLESLMLRRLGNRVHNLRIHVLETGVVIEGRAPTYYVKQLAQHAA